MKLPWPEAGIPMIHFYSRVALWAVVGFFIAAFDTGCTTTPRLPKVLDSTTPILMYATNEFLTDFKMYKEAFNNENTNRATALRNAMFHRINGEIEGNYRDFEAKLFSGRESFHTAADFIELGLAGATTILIGERSKTVLAAILTAVKGARLSVDKNWFRERTTESIIASMQSERNKKMEVIEKKLIGNAMEYPFEEAWVDLIEYFYAGTLEGGIQALTVETGKTAATAKAARKKAAESRAESFTIFKATEGQIIRTKALTQKVRELKEKKNAAEARRILQALGVPPGPDDKLFDQLQGQIREAVKKGPESVEALSKTFGIQPQ
ncbi:MAG: hypothetical protein HY674_13390 [Chloroflexi bacterium]|nr:hypothetical protein [Chloroflexota bacterium]